MATVACPYIEPDAALTYPSVAGTFWAVNRPEPSIVPTLLLQEKVGPEIVLLSGAYACAVNPRVDPAMTLAERGVTTM